MLDTHVSPVTWQMGVVTMNDTKVEPPAAKRAKASDAVRDLSLPGGEAPTLRKSISHEDLQTDVRGEVDTHDTRFFSKDSSGEHRSLWHDLPLFEMDAASKATGCLNFVCEIPKWTRKKVRACV
jgi:hypothetical protein